MSTNVGGENESGNMTPPVVSTEL